MKKRTKIASTCGVAGTGVTGGTLMGITASLTGPAANLGGYATAQIVASSTLGLGGPVVATTVATLGGPLVAGGLLAVGAGFLIGGTVRLLTGLFS